MLFTIYIDLTRFNITTLNISTAIYMKDISVMSNNRLIERNIYHLELDGIWIPTVLISYIFPALCRHAFLNCVECNQVFLQDFFLFALKDFKCNIFNYSDIYASYCSYIIYTHQLTVRFLLRMHMLLIGMIYQIILGKCYFNQFLKNANELCLR